MSWRAVARLEARDARRSRALRTVVVMASVVGVAADWLPAIALGEGLTAERAVAFLVTPLKLAVGLTGLLAGYGAVAGPRTAGQLKLALGLPNARSGLVLGAFVGRSAVVLVGVAVALVAVVVALWVTYGTVPIRPLAGFGGLLALFAGSITALAVGLSAASPSRGGAAVAAVSAFVAFEFLWGVVPAGAHYLVEGSLPGAVVPPWVVLLERLQPFAAFETAAEVVLPVGSDGVRLSGGGAEATAVGTRSLADRLAGTPPTYLDPAAGILMLVVWAVVPLWIGLARFNRVDL